MGKLKEGGGIVEHGIRGSKKGARREQIASRDKGKVEIRKYTGGKGVRREYRGYREGK